MKKTLTSLSAIGLAAIATPAFAHHSEQAGFMANIAHWLSSPMHSLGTLTAIAALGFAAYKLTRKNTQA